MGTSFRGPPGRALVGETARWQQLAQAAKQVALLWRETFLDLGTGKKPFTPGRWKIAHVKECFHHRLLAFRRQVIILRKKSARFLPLGGRKAFKDFLPLAHLLFLFR